MLDVEQPKHSVFIVEDEPIIAIMLEEMIKEIGWTVRAISLTKQDAITKARNLDCDVAIIDLELNGEVSYDIARLLKQRGIPLCFATGHSAENRPAELSNVPAIHKPFDELELRSTVEGLLSASGA